MGINIYFLDSFRIGVADDGPVVFIKSSDEYSLNRFSFRIDYFYPDFYGRLQSN